MEDAVAPPGPLSLRHQGQVSFHLQPPALHLHPQALGPEGRQHPRPGDGVVGRHPQPRGRLPLDHAALQPPVLAGGEQFPALLRRQHHHGRAGKGLGKAVAGNDRVLLNEEERRFLEPPKADQLYKVI